MIFDTDVLIWYFRGNRNARDAVSNARSIAISAVTYMELVQGMKNKAELAQLKKLIETLNIRVIDITPEITKKAMSLVEKYYLSNSMEMADALIAASCLSVNGALYTANDKHYKVVEHLTYNVFRP